MGRRWRHSRHERRHEVGRRGVEGLSGTPTQHGGSVHHGGGRLRVHRLVQRVHFHIWRGHRGWGAICDVRGGQVVSVGRRGATS